MRALAAASAAIFALAAPALGQDRGQEWTGPYIGANVGYGWGNVGVTDTNGGVDPGPFKYTTQNIFGGGSAGYNLHLGPAVVGIEGDLGYMNVNGSGIIPSSTPPNHQDLTLDSGLYADVTGRLGFAAGRTLFYGKAGWAYFDSHAQQVTTKPGYSPTSTGAFDGWVYGGGIEHKFAPNLSLKVEYLHFDFGSQAGAQTSITDPPIGFVYTNSHDVTVDTVKVGINYSFGEPETVGSLK